MPTTLRLIVLLFVVSAFACNRKASDLSSAPPPPPKPFEKREVPNQVDSEIAEAEANFPKPKAAQTLEKRVENLQAPILEFSRTGCFGQCPVYHLTVGKDGKATYEGKRNVPMKGTYQTTLNEEQLKALVARINEADFYKLETAYPEADKMIADLPNAITTYTWRGRAHTVTNNHNAPEALLKLEAYFDDMIKQMEWMEVKK